MTASAPWWYAVPHYAEIATGLEGVPAIDVHTHLGRPIRLFDQPQFVGQPLRMRSTEPSYAAALSARFRIAVGSEGMAGALRQADSRRTQVIEELGLIGYLHDHLDFTNTEVALINRGAPEGTDGRRLRWVPYGSIFLYPLPADELKKRSPDDATDIGAYQEALHETVAAHADGMPSSLGGYLQLVDAAIRHWKAQGAVALKFDEAYRRTLVFSEIPFEDADKLYRDGQAAPLGRDRYLALQDYVARHLFLEAGRQDLSIHLHTGPGGSAFLQLRDAEVQNLEPVLTDVQFSGTQFVLIHAGGPQFGEAIYLASRANVWLDTSALPFVYEVPRLAEIQRDFLRHAPEKVLFGTDVQLVPVGPEIQHIALTRHAREALYLALAGMVHDQLVDRESAVRIGRGVIRENAQRLFGWD